jgi:hypothetical protein
VKFLPFVVLSVVGVAILTDIGFAQNPRPRTTTIFFTLNHKTKGGGGFAADCLGSVVTETIPSNKGDTITWKIVDGNAETPAGDKCKGFDPSKVSLKFMTNIAFGKDELTPTGGLIRGTVLKTAPSDSRHKYVVKYGGAVAGPDPEIVVDCSSCGSGEQ